MTGDRDTPEPSASTAPTAPFRRRNAPAHAFSTSRGLNGGAPSAQVARGAADRNGEDDG